MHTSKRRILDAYSRITDERLRDLVAQLVNVYAQQGGGRTPKQQYRALIDSFAQEYQSEFSSEYLLSEKRDEPDVQSRHAHPTEGLITLQSIRLCNFRSYRDETTIELAPLKDRNVTVVVGSNGHGKSSIFYALNWALYGEDYLQDLKREKGLTLENLINENAIQEARIESTQVNFSVTLSFRIRGTDHYVTRAGVALPTGESSVTVSSEAVRLGRITPDGQHVSMLEGALDVVLSVLPKHVRDFYFFDGEQINRFVAANNQLHIRRAIRRVMGIDALENSAKDVEKVAEDLRKEVRAHSSGDLERINRALENAHVRLSEARNTFDAKSEDLIFLGGAIKELDELLEKSPDVRPYQQQRMQLEKAYKDLITTRINLLAEIRELATETSLVLAGDAVSKLVEQLDGRRERGVIPGPINKRLLQDLLERGTCICGTDVGSPSAAQEHLHHTLKELEQQANFGETALALYYQLVEVDHQIIKSAGKLDRKRIELHQLEDRLRANRDELAEVETTIGGMKVVDRAGWESERIAKREAERNATVAKALAESEIEACQKEIQKLKAEHQIYVDKASKEGQLAIRRDWAEAAVESIRSVYNQFAKAARQDVEITTTELWRTMLQNVAGYRVMVSDSFELRVVDSTGDAMQKLSMGQQQCLGLAFITAVAQVAESRPPLVIDMPFGRLGADVASSVARSLPTLTEQLILFVLPDTEWNDQTKGAILPHLAREYHLQFDEIRRASSLITAGV